MKGLLTKEWYLIKRNQLFTVFCVLIFAFIGIMSNGEYWFAYIFLLLNMLPLNSLIYDETSRWQQYSLAMPYTRKNIVSAKYILTLIITLFSTLVMSICLFIKLKMNGNVFNNDEFWITVSLMPATGLLIPLITIPFSLKFGSTRGRFIVIFLMGAFTAIVGIVITDFSFVNIIADYAKSLMGLFGIIPLILVPLAALFAISWLISIKVFEKKDM